jgi:hypothetical protein
LVRISPTSAPRPGYSRAGKYTFPAQDRIGAKYAKSLGFLGFVPVFISGTGWVDVGVKFAGFVPLFCE